MPGLGLQASPIGSGWSCARRGAQHLGCPEAAVGSGGSVGAWKGLVPSLEALRESLLAQDSQCLCFDTVTSCLEPVGPISA